MSAPGDAQQQTHEGAGGIASIKRASSSSDGSGSAYAGTKRRRTSAGGDEASPSANPDAAPPPAAAPAPARTNTTTSSRGVANLTPTQLAKKRANDREAQRAIRQRTRDQIERLQATIDELTSRQPYQELQAALRAKEAVEAENREIRKRLEDVLGLIAPILGRGVEGGGGSNGLDILSYPQPAQPYIPHRASSGSNMNVSTPSSAASPMTGGPGPAPSQWQSPNPPTAHDPRAYPPQMKQAAQQRQDMPSSFDMAPERAGLDFILDSGQRIPADGNTAQKTPMPTNGINGVPAPSSFHQIPRELERHHHPSGGQRSSSIASNTSFGASYSPSTSTTPTGASLSSAHPDASSLISAHTAPISNGAATCPLDSLLLNFLHDRQTLLDEGTPPSLVLGPPYPNVATLLHPSHTLPSHPLSKVFTDVLATFPDLSSLPEQVALLYIMFLLMRWQISPGAETYERLPDFCTPRPAQLFTPHPAWIDHLPWPRMRDYLVQNYSPREYLFDNFITPFTEGLSLNWPFPAEEVLVGTGEECAISPRFERHLRSLENWTLGEAFGRRFPGLRGTYFERA